MTWSRWFQSQAYNQPLYKHIDLPIYETIEFDFFRCLEFNESFYGKTVSELHAGNLTICTGRYSCLFPGQKLSYWANSPQTARAEVKRHGATKDLITFWAYDDTSSFRPTIEDTSLLRIVDGRKCGIQELINKVDNGETITPAEKKLLDDIMQCEPDALAFDSHAREGGENFIFFEKGFKKLSLREVQLRLGERPAKNAATIGCALSSDYYPHLESYGKYFAPVCRIKKDEAYLDSDEYTQRSYCCGHSQKI